MIRKVLPALALAAMLISGAHAFAQAQEDAGNDTAAAVAKNVSITYPIAELGGCRNKAECKTYCDVAANRTACIDYGQKSGLMDSQQASAARTILAKKGPGACTTKESCRSYCSDVAHTEECISFAQKYGAIATSTAVLIKKIKVDGGPGGCTSADECKTYCSDISHLAECKSFGQTSGLIEKGPNTKITTLLASKPGPGGCTSQSECKTFCSNKENGTVCRQFALENGLISQEQYDATEKVVDKVGPGGCTGEDCKTYCSDSSHASECYAFAVENGIVSKDQADQAETLRETLKQGGPGGCTSPDTCRAYCSDLNNREACAAFAQSRKNTTEEGSSVPDSQHESGAPTTSPQGTIPNKKPLETREEYCKTHRDTCTVSPSGEIIIKTNTETPRSSTAKPAADMPTPTIVPKPSSTPTTTSSTSNIPCKSLDECVAMCTKSATLCATLPPDVQKYIQARIQNTNNTTETPTPPTTTPPPTTSTTPPPSTNTTPVTNSSDSSATKPPETGVFCNTLAECKALCIKSTAQCAALPPEIQQAVKASLQQTNTLPLPIPPLPQPTSTSVLGAAVIEAFMNLFGF